MVGKFPHHCVNSVALQTGQMSLRVSLKRKRGMLFNDLRWKSEITLSKQCELDFVAESIVVVFLLGKRETSTNLSCKWDHHHQCCLLHQESRRSLQPSLDCTASVPVRESWLGRNHRKTWKCSSALLWSYTRQRTCPTITWYCRYVSKALTWWNL